MASAAEAGASANAAANATWTTYSDGRGVAKYTTTTSQHRAARGSSAAVVSAAPPGSFYGGGVQPVPAHNFAPTQPARRFPGHFAPHRLCNHFSAHGWCKKAEACTFAHGIQELHADVQAQLAPAVNGANPAPIVVGPKGQVSIAPHVAPAVPVAGTKKVTYLSTSMPGGVTMPAGMISAGFSGLSTTAPIVAATEAAQDPNFKFNVAAKPFAPPVELSASAKPFVPSPATAATAAADGGAAGGEEKGEQSDDAGSSPSRRRPAPAPLNLDESPAMSGVQPRLSQTIASLAGSPITVHAARVGTTPAGASTVWQPLSSPKTIVVSPARYVIPAKPSVLASPTAAGQTVAHSMAMNVLSSPTAASGSTAPTVLASPTAARTLPAPLLSPTTKYVLRSPAGSAWPISPGVVVSSPKPGTPVPIPRGMLLQARNVSINIGQGAPGLPQPTPTTRAKGLGFALPQPGVIVSKDRTEVIKEA